MDCLKSFSFASRSNSNFTGAQVKSWTSGTEIFWQCEPILSSTFTIEGFKNINIFGIDIVGSVNTIPSAALGGAIIQDWRVGIVLDGQLPLMSGNILAAPNDWSIATTGINSRTFEVGRYKTSIMFGDPIQSVRNIQLTQLYAQGSGGQTAGNVNLAWNLNFVFYYKFEGE